MSPIMEMFFEKSSVMVKNTKLFIKIRTTEKKVIAVKNRDIFQPFHDGHFAISSLPQSPSSSKQI